MEVFKEDPGIQKCRTVLCYWAHSHISIFSSGTKSKRKQPTALYQKRMINGRGGGIIKQNTGPLFFHERGGKSKSYITNKFKMKSLWEI